jgi:hypothetical protein
LRVPKERRKNVLFRRHLYLWARKDKPRQKALLDYCKKDIIFWINAFVWQFNPNSIGTASEEVGPFITWDYQDPLLRELLACIDPATKHDTVIEKSREMGASWLCLLVIVWMYLFHPMKKFLFISRDADSVDKPDDTDSLFWKIEYVIAKLPSWMRRGRSKKRKMGFKNPLLGSTITGQASTRKAGVSGRATAIFVDEFSQIDADYHILQRTRDTSGCRIFNGTHVGTGTAFFELCNRIDMHKIQIHWSQHPDKRRGLYRYNAKTGQVEVLDKEYKFPPDFKFVMEARPAGGPYPGIRSPWYDKQCARSGSPRAIAMDLDIDAAGSQSQFFDPLMLHTLKETYAVPPYWQGELHYDRETAQPIALIPSPSGKLKLWCNLVVTGFPARGDYGAGADIANGTGATPSCLCIGNAMGEQVAEYVDATIPPEDFAVLAVAILRCFKTEEDSPAWFAWEMAGPGLKFGQEVVRLGYRNIYYRMDDTDLKRGASTKPGWYPDPARGTRIMLEDLRAALFQRDFIVHSEQLLEECKNFIYGPRGEVLNGKTTSKAAEQDPSGAGAGHSDRVIGGGLCYKMVKQFGKKRTGGVKQEIPPGSLADRRRIREDGRKREMAWG